MRILFIFAPLMAVLKTGVADVIFTRERCDRALFGLQVQPGEPSRYRQCGPNGRVWIVPCVPGAVFDPVIKVCKELPATTFPSSSIRRKSGKSEENRRTSEAEQTPIAEEFIFSTKRPKRPRPKTKGPTVTPTAPSTSQTSSTTTQHSTTSSTLTFPVPSPLPTPKMTTPRPYRPAFTPPNRRVASSTVTKRPQVQTTGTTTTTRVTTPSQRYPKGPIPISESQMTGAYPSTYEYTPRPQMHTSSITVATTSAEHLVNYKGITMSEDEFLKQLIRIVEAHQVAINKIEDQVEEERQRGIAGTAEQPVDSFRKQGTNGNYGEERSNMEMEESERQRQQEITQQMAERQQKERQELEWQQEVARQQAERQRKEEETRRQQEYARQMSEMQRAQKEMEWQREVARQRLEMERKEKERQMERARQLLERQRQEEELLRQQELAEIEKKEAERQKQIARQAAERKKHEEEMKRQEKARKKAEMIKKERERQQEIARQIEETQRQEEVKRQEEARQLAERQKKERERQEEIARQLEGRQRREKEEKEQIRLKKLEEERLIKEEEQRQEAQRRAEEERRVQEQLAAQEEETYSTPTHPVFGMHIPAGNEAGEHSIDYFGYNTNNDVTKTVLAGLMSMNSRQTSTEAPQLEIIHFTAPPPTPSSPANEWVTSPHSWRPPPDMQTNVLEWTQTPIPSTGISELPSTVISACDSRDECAFSYEDDLLCPHPRDASLYLQCTPVIGRPGRWTERMCPPNLVFIPSHGRCGLNVGQVHDPNAARSFIIPRLPSDPEYVYWQGNKELQQNVAQLPYQPAATLAPPYQTLERATTLTPILQTIEEFPRDLLPPFSYIHNTIPPTQFEPNEEPNMDPSVINPLFPRVQPHFLMPFGKFRDGLVNSGNSLMGSIIKPAIKKIAMDQTESFLDRILADEIAKETKSSERESVASRPPEDGWRKSG